MVKLDVKTKSASGVVRVFLCRNVCFFGVEAALQIIHFLCFFSTLLLDIHLFSRLVSL